MGQAGNETTVTETVANATLNQSGGPPGSDSLNSTNGFLDQVAGLLPPWVPWWLVEVTYAASQLIREALARRVARRFRRPSVARTVLRVIQSIVIALGGVVVLGVLDIELGDIALSLSVFTVVLGFILAPIIGSIINGLFVLSDRAYEIGDMIELEDTGTRGFVEDITLPYTKIFTLDNTFLVIPNGTIRDRDVINYSAEDARTRLSLDLQVTYESDIEQARELMEKAARKVDNVIGGGPDIRIGSARYPASPTCYIESYADHGVNLRLRYWISEPYKLLTARSKVQTNLWELLEDAGVEIAYPHQHVVFDDTSGEMRVAVRERAADERVPGRATRQGARDIDSEEE
jgi:small-conductance mechanosensitive channel